MEVQSNNKKTFVCSNHKLIFQYWDLLPCIYVDEGAVEPLINDSLLKEPDIQQCSQLFEKDAVVAWWFLENEYDFALGIDAKSSEHLKGKPKGTAIDMFKHILKYKFLEKRDSF